MLVIELVVYLFLTLNIQIILIVWLKYTIRSTNIISKSIKYRVYFCQNSKHLITYREHILLTFPAQSTPQTYRGRAAVRRQSSVGPLNDTSPLTGGTGAGEPVVSTPAHSATLPVSSLSTNPSSYYTNASPSPPVPAPVHVSCDDILAPSAAHSAGRAPSSRSAPHSAVNLHQTGRPTALPFTAERLQNTIQVRIFIAQAGKRAFDAIC